MSPIFVRPVREQLEHDRLVRHLQAKYKKKFEVAANLGEEQVAPVKIGAVTLFPDLVLTENKKIAGIVEVESGESVNNLEAMAQWVHFSRARVPFHLYVPMMMFEAARRLCESYQARVSEIWTYRPALDGFDLMRMSADVGAVKASTGPKAATPKPAPAKPAPVEPAPTSVAVKPKPAPAPPKVAKAPKVVSAAKAAKPVAKPARKPEKNGHSKKKTAKAKGKTASKRRR